ARQAPASHTQLAPAAREGPHQWLRPAQWRRYRTERRPPLARRLGRRIQLRLRLWLWLPDRALDWAPGRSWAVWDRALAWAALRSLYSSSFLLDQFYFLTS